VESLAITLTLTTLMSFMFLLVGGMIGWLFKQHTYERGMVGYTHPEMFDENGNLIPDDVLAVRFENPEELED